VRKRGERAVREREVRACDRCGKRFEGAVGQEYGPCCQTLDDLRDNDRWIEPDGE
jgi:hypothetical protein